MGWNKQVVVQKARISPLGCYLEGKDLLGTEYGLFLGICLVGLLLGGLVPIVLYGPAFCGMALCFLARARGDRVNFELLFKGFDYFMPSLMATLIYMGAAFVLIIPFTLFVVVLMAVMASNHSVLTIFSIFLMVGAYVGWILIMGVAAMIFMFSVFLIVDKNLDGPTAMSWALKGVTTNFLGVFASAIVGQLIILVGTMMCIVPGLLLIPIVFAGHFVVYRKIFGVETQQPVMAQVV